MDFMYPRPVESLLIAQSTVKGLCWTLEFGILYIIMVIVAMITAGAICPAHAVCQAAGEVPGVEWFISVAQPSEAGLRLSRS